MVETPAEPKLNLVDIPGADGSKDKSELPGGRLFYNDRTVSWTFALYPGEDWATKHRQVSNALNGKRCRITLDSNLDYYYTGRVVVRDYNLDRALRQITVEATCSPYLLKQYPTIIEKDLSTEYLEIHLPNEKKRAVPTIEVTEPTSIRWEGLSADIAAGVPYTSLDIELQEGDNILEAKVASGAGKIVVTYQEGSL